MRGSQTLMRNGSFLIGESPPQIRICLFLIQGKSNLNEEWAIPHRGERTPKQEFALVLRRNATRICGAATFLTVRTTHANNLSLAT